jgi:hypothetical protein
MPPILQDITSAITSSVSIQNGVQFGKTFATVRRLVDVKLVLNLAASHKRFMKQLLGQVVVCHVSRETLIFYLKTGQTFFASGNKMYGFTLV